jgi:cation transport ATPase
LFKTILKKHFSIFQVRAQESLTIAESVEVLQRIRSVKINATESEEGIRYKDKLASVSEQVKKEKTTRVYLHKNKEQKKEKKKRIFTHKKKQTKFRILRNVFILFLLVSLVALLSGSVPSRFRGDANWVDCQFIVDWTVAWQSDGYSIANW